MRRKSAIAFLVGFLAFAAIAGYVVVKRSHEFLPAAYGTFVSLLLLAAGVFGLLTEVFGTEVIELEGFTLSVSDKVFGFDRLRTFEITLMKNVRFGSSTYWQGSTYVMSNGRIQFDYEGKTISIGGNASEDEVFAIMAGIRRQLTFENLPR